MRKFIGLNWKMNPKAPREALALARTARKAGRKHTVVVFPPFPFLPAVSKIGKGISLGAQDFFHEPKGAYTGEVSLPMLKSFGVRYALVGHSERRAIGETDSLILKKLKAARGMKVTPVLCVGEPWSVRRKGRRVAEAYVRRQLAVLGRSGKGLIVAYEPLWAIGTGRACSVSDAAAMAKFIKRVSRVKTLYGGSVDAKNVKAFLSESKIDGALVGGASADLRKLRAMAKALK